jgi:aspartyl protease family protein
MRDGDQALNFVYLLGCLVLVGSGLAARRLPLGQTMKIAVAWICIFAGLFLIFTLRNDFKALGSRMLAEITGNQAQQVAGGTIRIQRADDGHFWVDAEVNGRLTHFLVDSGCTITTINRNTASGAGIEPSGHFPVIVDTANGRTVAQRASAETLKLGPIERRDFEIQISNAADDINLLGMNFLSSLRGWRVEGSTLVLQP